MIQSVIFNKYLWTISKANKWLHSHGLKLLKDKDVDITKNYYRFRIKPPELFNHFFMKDLKNGVKLVIGY